MTRINRNARLGWMVGAVVLAVATATLGAILVGPRSATAGSEAADAELRAYWQGRYRDLRKKEAMLVETVRLATKEYADSNRRSYRRSGVRHFHRTNANEAKAQLRAVRVEIAQLYDGARDAGVPVFWLDEVAEEPIDPNSLEGIGDYADDGPFGGEGAYAEDSDEDDSDVGPDGFDDGRNPLYSGDGEDNPASLEDDDTKKSNYREWRKNREEYERLRAPEEHLAPDWTESAEGD